MRRALVVGINAYPGSPLSAAVNDASAFGSTIETNGDGSPNFSVRLATDVATKAELKAQIVELFAQKADTALFYFSGHGVLESTGGYLATPDYQTHDMGVSMDELLSIANKSPVQNRVIILDCCHSGAFGSPESTGGEHAHIREGVTILTSSRKTEVSMEGDEHGVFTNLLLAALRGGAADLRGHITAGSIYAYIDQALGAWDARPVFKTNIVQFNAIRTVVPQISIEVLRRLLDYFPEPEHQLGLDPSFEPSNSPEFEHEVIVPHADPEKTRILDDLQRMEGVGLVVPVDEEHMYYAAMRSKACRLTALGYHYWRLVKDKKI